MNESEVDAFVSNNGYSIGPHTTDSNTQLSNAEVIASVLSNGNTIEAEFANLQAQVNDLIAAVAALENSQSNGGDYVAPYEPWNPSTTMTELIFERKAYWMSFHAPSTGSYTNATIKISNLPSTVNRQFSGPIRVGIYDNAEVSPLGTLPNGFQHSVQNIPSGKLGDSTLDFTAPTNVGGYIDFVFEAPIHLVKDQLYWFALSHHHNNFSFLYIDFHPDHHYLSGTVLEQASGNPNAELPPQAVMSNLLFSERAFWFRIYQSSP